MSTATSSNLSRLRMAAVLLLSLPATVATACFAHGHGALGSWSLLAILATAIAAGAWGAYGVLRLTPAAQTPPARLPRAAVLSLVKK
ncbi:MAG TPA: hypothetical protein VFV11_05045 [Solimonas sp.]|nr:hypothetical protein [Solimonas sp.]